jgi:hypothetical protein
VEELMAKAEEADSRPLEEGLKIPEEIKLREDRKAALEKAKQEMEARYEEAKREREVRKAAEKEGKKGKSGGGKEKPLAACCTCDFSYYFVMQGS